MALVRGPFPRITAVTVAALAAAAVIGFSGGSAALAIVAPIAVGFLALAVVRPFAAVVALVTVRPFVDVFLHEPLSWAGHSVALATAWGALLILLLVALILRLRPSLLDLREYLVPAAFAIGYMAMTASRAGVPASEASQGLPNWTTNEARLASSILLLFVVQQLARRARSQALLVGAMLLMASFVVVAVGISIMRNAYGGGYYYAGPFDFSSNQSPYAYGATATLLIPFAFAAMLARSRRVLPSVLLALLVASVVLSFSRTAYLALAGLTAGFFGRAILFRRTKELAAVLGVGAIAFAIAFVAFPGVIEHRFAHGGERLVIWRPLFDSTVHSARTLLIGGGTRFSYGFGYPHDDFLITFSSGGVVLLALFLAFIAWMALPVIGLTRDAAQSPTTRGFALIVAGGILAFTAVAIFDGIVFTVMMSPLAVLLGIARAMVANPRKTLFDDPVLHEEPLRSYPIPALVALVGDAR